jgi:kynurenine formamidase
MNLKFFKLIWPLSILFFFAAGTQPPADSDPAAGCTKSSLKDEVRKMNSIELRLSVKDLNDKTRAFRLTEPAPVSREVDFFPVTKAPNGFSLPRISRKTFVYKDKFIGNVGEGGACNVDILNYVPHGLTHIETSAHILMQDENAVTIKDIPVQNLSGLVYLLDITDIDAEAGRSVRWQDVEAKLKKITLPIRMLALKTQASLQPRDTDFSGKDFLYLSPETAEKLHDFKPRINCLLLDLPSIDRESDGGKLAAHRHFFGLPQKGCRWEDKEKRTLVELAWFSDLQEGYYYAFITPQRFQTNAVSTGIVFHPLLEI